MESDGIRAWLTRWYGYYHVKAIPPAHPVRLVDDQTFASVKETTSRKLQMAMQAREMQELSAVMEKDSGTGWEKAADEAEETAGRWLGMLEALGRRREQVRRDALHSALEASI